MLTLLCAWCMLVSAQDPVRVSASLTASRVSVGASTTLQVTVETTGAAPEDIRLPPLPPELEVVGTGDFSSMQLSTSGRSRVIRRDILLSPRRAGVYRIPAVTVQVRGRVYHTTPLELTVDGAMATPRGGDPPPTGGPSLSLWLQPDTVFVGEEVLLHVEALFSDEMRLRQTRPASFDPPAPSGFWVQDLPNPVTVSLRVRDGRTVEMQTFRRAYFPLSAGRFMFPPAKLHYELRRGFLYAPESRQIESDSVPLVVLPLPEDGRPDGFTGAVGSFALRAALAPRRVNLGDATTLELEVEGFGNVKALPEPRLPDVMGVEVFSPTQDSRVDVKNDRVGGVKRFRWVIVPEQPGTVVIPPIEYAYFDPAERKYQVLRTDTLRLEAVPVVAAVDSDTALRALRSAERRSPFGWTYSPVFVVLQAVPLLGLIVLVGMRRRRERQPTRQEVKARVAAEINALAGVPAGAAFLTELERVLLRGTREILGGDDTASTQLRARGATSVAARLDALTAELRRLRYAPAAPFEQNSLIREALAVLDAVPLPRGGTGATVAVVIGMLIAAAAASSAVRASPAAWQAGVAAFEARDFVTAANSFYAYAQAHPRHADAWYNHGLAAHRAGDPGRAVWAWLRAARFAPRDRDIVHNLTLADAHDAYIALRPCDRLAGSERLLLLALAWWIVLAAIALRVLRQPRTAALVAIPALILAVFAVTGIAAQALRPQHVTALRSGTQLLAAPNARAESLGRFEPGAIARVRARRIGFLLVALGEGREAWVERGAVAAP